MAQQSRSAAMNNENQISTLNPVTAASSPASFSINVSSLNSDGVNPLHSINEDVKENGNSTNGSQGNSNVVLSSNAGPTSASGAAREARSLQRRLMASNDIHEVFKFSQLKVIIIWKTCAFYFLWKLGFPALYLFKVKWFVLKQLFLFYWCSSEKSLWDFQSPTFMTGVCFQWSILQVKSL